MTLDDSWLPTTAYAVLGLLAIGEEHTAYELKQRADATVAPIYWAPAMSAVYTELQRLEQLGLVRHRLEAETENRSRRVYRITAQGRRSLSDWIEHGRHDPTVVKNTTLLRLLFGHHTDPAVLTGRLDEHVEWARRELDDLDQALRDLKADAAETSAYPALVLEAAIATLRQELKITRDLATRLRAANMHASPGAQR